MYSINDIAYASFVFFQAGVWPQSLGEWATLIGPLSLLIAGLTWLVNHFIIKPLKETSAAIRKDLVQKYQQMHDEMVEEDARLGKAVRSLRRMVQTYVGRVGVLDDNIRDCSSTGEANGRKIASLEARSTNLEKDFRQIENDVRDIKNLLEYKVMEKLNEISDNRKEQK